MKRIIFLPLFFIIYSCAPEVDFWASNMPVFLDEPLAANVAGKAFASSDDCPVESIELTESGRLLLTYRIPVDDKGIKHVYGRYNQTSEGFILGDSLAACPTGIDSLVVKDGQAESVVIRKNDDGEKLSHNTVNLCRSWYPTQTVFVIRPANASKVGMSFSGCDVAEILATVNKTGANLLNVQKAGKWMPALKEAIRLSEKYKGRSQGMKVTDFTFTKQGTFIIGFENENPYVGEWKWLNEENGLMQCSFNLPDDNGENYTVESVCSIRYDVAGNADITVDASFTSKKIPYLTTIDLLCHE